MPKDLSAWDKQIICIALRDYVSRMNQEAIIYRRQDNTIASDDCRKHSKRAEELYHQFKETEQVSRES